LRQGPVRVNCVVLPDPGDVQLRHEQSGEMRMLQGMRGVPGRQVRSVQRLRRNTEQTNVQGDSRKRSAGRNEHLQRDRKSLAGTFHQVDRQAVVKFELPDIQVPQRGASHVKLASPQQTPR